MLDQQVDVRAVAPPAEVGRPDGASVLQAGTISPWVDRAVVLAAMLAFGLVCFYQYHLPGLYYDEAFDAVPAMQLLRGEPVELLRGVGVRLFGRDLPVMIGDYWGVVSSYAVLPLFALFGVGVLPIRLWPIGAGIVAVLLAYLAGRRLYNRPIGVGAAVLLAASPSFILWSRVGIYVISHIVAVTLGILLAYARWHASGQRRWLFLAALLTGVGLSTKLLFLWFLIAVPAAYVCLLAADGLALDRAAGTAPARWGRAAWERFRADVPLRGWADAGVAALGFGLTAFPVLYYNLVSQGSYRVLRANLFQTERGVNNFAFWENAKVQADALKVLLDGGYFWFYGGIYANPLAPPLVAASTVGLLLLVHGAPRYRRYRRATVFLLAFGAVIFVLSWFTVSILGATHLLILLPIPQLFLAAFAVLGARWLVERRPWPDRLRRWAVPALAALALAPLLAGDAWVTAQYHQALARTGGHMTFSSAIYSLAADLDAGGVRRPYALDWGFKYNLMILTEGRVTPHEIYGPGHQPGPEFEAALRAALAEPSPVFLAHPEEGSAYPRLEAFRRIVAASRRTIVQERIYRQVDGRPVYHVFRLG